MAGSSNPFLGLDLATLEILKADYISAIRALATSQSYTLNGRSLIRSDLGRVKETLGQLIDAINYEAGDSTNVTHVSFTGL